MTDEAVNLVQQLREAEAQRDSIGRAAKEWREGYEQMKDRAEKAEAEVKRYRGFCGEALCSDVERDRDVFEAENERLREALRYYADTGGARARQALGEEATR